MFTNHKAQGVVLYSRKMREADESFVLYTKEFGKIEVVGKSIRKITSKLRMNMSLFSLVEIGFIEGKGYNTLTDARTIASFSESKKSLGKLSVFYRISEIIRLLIWEQEKDEEIFFLVLNTFNEIEKSDFPQEKLKTLYCFFAFRLLYFLGYRLYIEECVFCGKKVEDSCYFNGKEKGVVCENCFTGEKEMIYLEDVSALKCFFKESIQEVLNRNSQCFVNILESYLEFVPRSR
jgi:DNA repair protein RecO (recombination protein O)